MHGTTNIKFFGRSFRKVLWCWVFWQRKKILIKISDKIDVKPLSKMYCLALTVMLMCTPVMRGARVFNSITPVYAGTIFVSSGSKKEMCAVFRCTFYHPVNCPLCHCLFWLHKSWECLDLSRNSASEHWGICARSLMLWRSVWNVILAFSVWGAMFFDITERAARKTPLLCIAWQAWGRSRKYRIE